ncbi:hypothetical protein K8R62_01065 [bacterium]|nr:hypothetical protein [bacterium]
MNKKRRVFFVTNKSLRGDVIRGGFFSKKVLREMLDNFGFIPPTHLPKIFYTKEWLESMLAEANEDRLIDIFNLANEFDIDIDISKARMKL